MATYVVLTKFTDQGIRNAKDSPKRAEAFKQMAETFGATVKEPFWTQGQYDIVTIVEAPDEISATALNLSISALGNVRTESLRAFSAAEMMTIVDKMMTGTIERLDVRHASATNSADQKLAAIDESNLCRDLAERAYSGADPRRLCRSDFTSHCRGVKPGAPKR